MSNAGLGTISWNSHSRATVLLTFLVDICNALESLTENPKVFQ